jgi:hypothetical protein
MSFRNLNFKKKYLLILSTFFLLLLSHPYQYSISISSTLLFHFSNLFSILVQSSKLHAQIVSITLSIKSDCLTLEFLGYDLFPTFAVFKALFRNQMRIDISNTCQSLIQFAYLYTFYFLLLYF